MRKWRIVRADLHTIQFFDESGHLIATTRTPKTKLWRTHNAPISDSLGDDVQSRPVFEMPIGQLTVKRTLNSDRFLANDFRYDVLDAEGAPLVTAVNQRGNRRTNVTFAGKEYELLKRGLFTFRVDLRESAKNLIEFRDRTPFWTISSRREFEATVSGAVDPILVVTSFFLGHFFTY